MLTFSIIVICILISAVFSGLEIAYITSDKVKIEMEAQSGAKINKILSNFIKNPSRFIATILIGNNLALVIYGIYMEKALTPFLEFTFANAFLILLIQTLISTLVILIFAEYLPKTFFKILKNKALAFFAFPMYVFYWLSKWLVDFFLICAKFILKKIFKLDIREDKPIFGRMELEQYLENQTTLAGEDELEHEVKIYKNALDFSSIKVKESMVPRTEIEALDIDTAVEGLRKKFIESGYSKILIYKNTIDDIIGFVHIYEMFKQPKSIHEVLLPVRYIPETMLAQEAMNNFIQQKKSVFIVVDEFGGTAGMLTIEDLIEEIFGEIEDEHDNPEHQEYQVNEHTYFFSGRLELDYLNEKYNLGFNDNESYETLAGLLFDHFERIPEVGEEIQIENKKIKIEKVSKTKIELIRLELTLE